MYDMIQIPADVKVEATASVITKDELLRLLEEQKERSDTN